MKKLFNAFRIVIVATAIVVGLTVQASVAQAYGDYCCGGSDTSLTESGDYCVVKYTSEYPFTAASLTAQEDADVLLRTFNNQHDEVNSALYLFSKGEEKVIDLASSQEFDLLQGGAVDFVCFK